MTVSGPEITGLLRAWAEGDREALDRLMPVVYAELRRAARNYMRRERRSHTLQATALVNEVYLRLVDITGVRWQDRAHFFAIAASMMRRILLDAARARTAGKRGGSELRITLDEDVAAADQAHDLIAIDDALRALSKMDPRKSQVVELRFFGGLSIEEIAEVLRISPQSVKRDWRLARAWLLKEIVGPPHHD
jgi:RNA polymerase sigma factor (TIGR02999 family)